MFTSKILYFYWVCLAEDDDDVVIESTKPLPFRVTKAFIRDNILGKSNEELAKVLYEQCILIDIVIL